MIMDFTTNQWAIVALVLVAGWLLGLMSRSGGGRWRRDYEAERAAHLSLRREYDDYRARNVVVRETVVHDPVVVDRRI